MDNILALIKKGNLEEAEKRAKALKDPGKRFFYQGLIWLIRKRYALAYNYLVTAYEEGKNDDDTKRAMAFTLFGLGAYKEAKMWLEKIRDKVADDWIFLTLTSLVLNDIVSARAYLSTAYEKDKNRTKEMLVLLYKELSEGHVSEETKEKFLKLLHLL
jgi:tetratricopeptide (TPR) repeat protein